jgi:hypothetical protein
MENYKLEKTQPAMVDLESIITSLRLRKEFENIIFHYSVIPDVREDLYKVTMGIKEPKRWIFKEVSVLEARQVELGLLFMEQKLFRNIVAYGINSAITKIEERNAIPKS